MSVPQTGRTALDHLDVLAENFIRSGVSRIQLVSFKSIAQPETAFDKPAWYVRFALAIPWRWLNSLVQKDVSFTVHPMGSGEEPKTVTVKMYDPQSNVRQIRELFKASLGKVGKEIREGSVIQEQDEKVRRVLQFALQCDRLSSGTVDQSSRDILEQFLRGDAAAEQEAHRTVLEDKSPDQIIFESAYQLAKKGQLELHRFLYLVKIMGAELFEQKKSEIVRVLVIALSAQYQQNHSIESLQQQWVAVADSLRTTFGEEIARKLDEERKKLAKKIVEESENSEQFLARYAACMRASKEEFFSIEDFSPQQAAEALSQKGSLQELSYAQLRSFFQRNYAVCSQTQKEQFVSSLLQELGRSSIPDGFLHLWKDVIKLPLEPIFVSQIAQVIQQKLQDRKDIFALVSGVRQEEISNKDLMQQLCFYALKKEIEEALPSSGEISELMKNKLQILTAHLKRLQELGIELSQDQKIALFDSSLYMLNTSIRQEISTSKILENFGLLLTAFGGNRSSLSYSPKAFDGIINRLKDLWIGNGSALSKDIKNIEKEEGFGPFKDYFTQQEDLLKPILQLLPDATSELFLRNCDGAKSYVIGSCNMEVYLRGFSEIEEDVQKILLQSVDWVAKNKDEIDVTYNGLLIEKALLEKYLDRPQVLIDSAGEYEQAMYRSRSAIKDRIEHLLDNMDRKFGRLLPPRPEGNKTYNLMLNPGGMGIPVLTGPTTSAQAVAAAVMAPMAVSASYFVTERILSFFGMGSGVSGMLLQGLGTLLLTQVTYVGATQLAIPALSYAAEKTGLTRGWDRLPKKWKWVIAGTAVAASVIGAYYTYQHFHGQSVRPLPSPPATTVAEGVAGTPATSSLPAASKISGEQTATTVAGEVAGVPATSPLPAAPGIPVAQNATGTPSLPDASKIPVAQNATGTPSLPDASKILGAQTVATAAGGVAGTLAPPPVPAASKISGAKTATTVAKGVAGTPASPPPPPPSPPPGPDAPGIPGKQTVAKAAQGAMEKTAEKVSRPGRWASFWKGFWEADASASYPGDAVLFGVGFHSAAAMQGAAHAVSNLQMVTNAVSPNPLKL